MPMPESMEMYPGTSGNTHGDKNEISPARNAPARETSVIPDSSSLQHVDSLFQYPRTRNATEHSADMYNFKGSQVYKAHWLPGNRP
jgi:hypothetical protein